LTTLLNRASLRDAIRRDKLRITPPIDTGTGIAGAVPPNRPDPSNQVLNDCISNALAKINRRVGFNTVVNVPLTVPVTFTNGPQEINLSAQIPPAYSLNDISRVFWTPTGSPVGKVLEATLWQTEDRRRWDSINYPPSMPERYYTDSYSLFLLPGSSGGGTLSLYIGQGILSPQNDGDFITLLSIDCQDVIVTACAVEWLLQNPEDAEQAAKLQTWGTELQVGVEELLNWKNSFNQKAQQSIGFLTYRTGVSSRRNIR